MKRFQTLLVMGATMFLITGCGILPEEEELRNAPIVPAYETEEYNFALVEQGDLISQEDIVCMYQPTEEEKLSFPVGGEYYGNVYVKAGDEVKKGDLLAELKMEDVIRTIDDSKLAITKLELQIEYINNMISLETDRLKITKETAENSYSIKNYLAQITQIEDALYIAKERLKEKEEFKKQRQIYAGMDGIISSIKVTREGDRSVEAETFITVMDSTLSFTAKTKNWKRFTIGEKADILVGEETYQTEIKSMEEEVEGSKVVKFSLIEPTTNLPQGARGTYTLILEEKKNILYVPNAAVTMAGDESIVYCFDKDGLKTVKKVETGLAADGKIEILSGLQKDERVILD